MAVMEALLIQDSDAIYAIPMASVLEITKEEPQNLHSAMGKRLLVKRKATIPILDLHSLLDSPCRIPNADDQKKVTVLIVKHQTQSFGVRIDQVLRKEQILIKPLPSTLAGIPFVSGASILGDGRAILILDPRQLAQAL